MPDFNGLLPDHEIARLVKACRLIDPFEPGHVREGVISYGLSSYGYDCRLAPELLWIQPAGGFTIDPKTMDPQRFTHQAGNVLTLPANSFALGRTIERFELPRDISGLIVNKSTYARAGLLVSTTWLECGWRGTVTLGISNLNNRPARIYAHEGIAQVLFLRGAAEPLRSYADRDGLYQDQREITVSQVFAPPRSQAAGR
jgi:dCTP deaminase